MVTVLIWVTSVGGAATVEVTVDDVIGRPTSATAAITRAITATQAPTMATGVSHGGRGGGSAG